jgi:hypothetical protein
VIDIPRGKYVGRRVGLGQVADVGREIWPAPGLDDTCLG